MNRDELIAQLGAPVKAQMVANLTSVIEGNDLKVTDLLDVSFHQKKEIAFRAAWMLEYVVTHRPLQFYPHVETFLSLLPKQKNSSAMRHYVKIIALITERKSNLLYKEALQRADLQPVIEVLFTWLVDPETPVAVKVHCMQALANLAPDYEWIKYDLLETIEYLVDIESVAFFARARMVKKQLNKR